MSEHVNPLKIIKKIMAAGKKLNTVWYKPETRKFLFQALFTQLETFRLYMFVIIIN